MRCLLTNIKSFSKKKEILKSENTCFKSIDLEKKYYETNYKNHKLN